MHILEPAADWTQTEKSNLRGQVCSKVILELLPRIFGRATLCFSLDVRLAGLPCRLGETYEPKKSPRSFVLKGKASPRERDEPRCCNIHLAHGVITSRR
jgi:hypothetical protein